MHMTELDSAALTLRALPQPVSRPRAELDAPRLRTGAPPAAGLALHVRGVTKAIDLRIAPGEFVAIVGRSGCGKSTLLRLVAALEQADAGEVTLDGAALAHHRQDIRIMFQDARLLPWKRVVDNIALGLPGPDGERRAREALAQVGLGDRADDWPAVLSCIGHACCFSTSRSAPWTR
jgi:sulfonate transport system ATP-binding protein